MSDPFKSDEERNNAEIALRHYSRYNGRVILKYCGEELKDNEEFVKILVSLSYTHDLLSSTSERLKNDKNFVLYSILNNGYCSQSIEYASARLRDDREVVEEAVRRNGYEIKFASERLKNDEKIAILSLKRNTGPFQHVGENLRSSKKFVLSAFSRRYSKGLQYCSVELRDDYDVVMMSVLSSPENFQFAGLNMRNNSEIASIFLKNIRPCSLGKMIVFLGDKLKNDLNFTLSLTSCGSGIDAIKHFPNLHINREFVHEAVKRNGFLLEFFDRFKNDKEIAMSAIRQSGYAFQFVGLGLKFDEDLIFEAVKEFGDSLYYVPPRFRRNKELIELAVRTYGHSIKFAGWNLTLEDDEDLIINALRRHGEALQHLKRFNHVKNIVMEAVKQNGMAIRFASENLKNDKSVVLAAARSNGLIISTSNRLNWMHGIFFPRRFLDDRDVVLAAVSQNGIYLADVKDKFKNDFEIVIAAVKQRGSYLKYAHHDMQNRKDVVIEAFRTFVPRMICYGMSEKLLNDRDVLLEAVKTSIRSFYGGVMRGFEEDWEIMVNACTGDDAAYSFRIASEKLKEDREFIKEVVWKKPGCYGFIPEKFRNDEEVILAKIRGETGVKFNTRECGMVRRCLEDLKERKDFLISQEFLGKYLGTKREGSVYDCVVHTLSLNVLGSSCGVVVCFKSYLVL